MVILLSATSGPNCICSISRSSKEEGMNVVEARKFNNFKRGNHAPRIKSIYKIYFKKNYKQGN